jgi:DNA-binding Lrp family transcriptional regulator
MPDAEDRRILEELEQLGTAKTKTLARSLRMDVGRVGQKLDKLERDNWVRRVSRRRGVWLRSLKYRIAYPPPIKKGDTLARRLWRPR